MNLEWHGSFNRGEGGENFINMDGHREGKSFHLLFAVYRGSRARNYACQIDAHRQDRVRRFSWLSNERAAKIHRPLGERGRKRNVTKFQPCHVRADIVQAEKLKRRENTVGNTCTVRIKRFW